MKEQSLHLEKENLKKDLKNRHIQLIAIGGVIGVALFMGSAQASKMAGPALTLAYALGGIVMYFVLRALGEVAVEHPVAASFAGYARAFCGPLVSFITGWTYWYQWVVLAMCEISAVGMYMKYWAPDIQQWIPALICLAVILAINLVSVKYYGEFEFWFALIKVVTIIAMLLVGFAMILFGFGNDGVAIGFSNLWTHGGFMPFGWTGVSMALVMVVFAYSGVELIGITAGEAADPEASLKSAIDKVFWRVLVFYVGSMVAILSIFPYETLPKGVSPFVMIFEKAGIPYAASIINIVIISSAASCLNSGMYVCGRMLYGLALRNEAPAFLGKLSANQVPANGILVSSGVCLIGVYLNYASPDSVFYYMSAITTTGCMWTWSLIMYIQFKWRKSLSNEAIANLKYPMPCYPYANYAVGAFMLAVTLGMGYDHDNLVGLYVAPVWYGGLFLLYKLFKIGEAQQKADLSIQTEW
ncbi:amino acid permease [Pelosinus fermentans]|uniref:Amino acid permease-associated region n=1 Tax=Pelosinus fermentans JBW45 TaxID=1192197 RepID=I9NUK6_9FIRM|nr:amino acid permease [Pelosinus fermentans]AJQ29841.1 amino acid permease-associated region [Pelosinus fermentans JBW45]